MINKMMSYCVPLELIEYAWLHDVVGTAEHLETLLLDRSLVLFIIILLRRLTDGVRIREQQTALLLVTERQTDNAQQF